MRRTLQFFSSTFTEPATKSAWRICGSGSCAACFGENHLYSAISATMHNTIDPPSPPPQASATSSRSKTKPSTIPATRQKHSGIKMQRVSIQKYRIFFQAVARDACWERRSSWRSWASRCDRQNCASDVMALSNISSLPLVAFPLRAVVIMRSSTAPWGVGGVGGACIYLVCIQIRTTQSLFLNTR